MIDLNYQHHKNNHFAKWFKAPRVERILNCYEGYVMSQINRTIQPFQAQAFVAGESDFQTISDHDFRGAWSILMFYPADFTFVCPTELEDLADHHATFKALGVNVYAVSTDSHFAHKAWHESSEAVGKVNYPMIGDPTGQLARQFDVYVDAKGMALRGTFVINPAGEIKVFEVHDDGIGRDVSELIRKVKAAQYVADHPNEACPAKWKEGAATLTPSLDLVGKI